MKQNPPGITQLPGQIIFQIINKCRCGSFLFFSWCKDPNPSVNIESVQKYVDSSSGTHYIFHFEDSPPKEYDDDCVTIKCTWRVWAVSGINPMNPPVFTGNLDGPLGTKAHGSLTTAPDFSGNITILVCCKKLKSGSGTSHVSVGTASGSDSEPSSGGSHSGSPSFIASSGDDCDCKDSCSILAPTFP
jgi:hypothetical protein